LISHALNISMCGPFFSPGYFDLGSSPWLLFPLDLHDMILSSRDDDEEVFVSVIIGAGAFADVVVVAAVRVPPRSVSEVEVEELTLAVRGESRLEAVEDADEDADEEGMSRARRRRFLRAILMWDE